MKEESEPVSGVAAPTGGSEAKHTKGPWRVYRNAYGIFKVTSDITSICEIAAQGTDERELANAELIARAPETARELAALKAANEKLREALESCKAWIPSLYGKMNRDDMTRCSGPVIALQDKIDAALGEKTATKD